MNELKFKINDDEGRAEGRKTYLSIWLKSAIRGGGRVSGKEVGCKKIGQKSTF